MDKLISFFKLLSDETRLRILVLLHHQKLCVCQMCGIMGESQPKISKHLAKLRDLGHVKDERQEQFIYYGLSIDDPICKDILQGIVDKIDNYPVIKSDIEKIKNADSYLATCNRQM